MDTAIDDDGRHVGAAAASSPQRASSAPSGQWGPSESSGQQARPAASGQQVVPTRSLQRDPGIYVHVPFCTRVCPYCDFAVQTGKGGERRTFVDALLREIDGWAGDGGAGEAARTSSLSRRAPRRPPRFRSDMSALHGTLPPRRAPSTVYVGGGTPSSLAPEQLGDVLEALRLRLRAADAAELTLEANPEDVCREALDAWHELGFTRLSLGVQSFDDDALAQLGRAHGAEQAAAAVEAALAAGFDAVSLDLIFAVPRQSPASWQATLQRAVDLQAHHISCYELTVHPGTRFHRARERGHLIEVADGGKADLFFATHRFLAAAGYPAYEVSNFAREDIHRSLHNTKYWKHAPYLGVGPSAHSFDGVARRWWNARSLEDWVGAVGGGEPVAGDEELRGPDLALEALALGLRTTDGVELAAIERRCGVDLIEKNAALIARLVADGLLREAGGTRLRPTLEGLALADAMATAFEISDEKPEPGRLASAPFPA